MPRTPDFQTSDIDLAAAIMTATGERPEISRDPGRELGTFHYPAVDAVHAVALAYASGDLVQPVKRFAACRAWLYRQVRTARRGAQ